MRFNRYMVECELGTGSEAEYFKNRFNRYMVECELNPPLSFLSPTKVLIDTWWNVNINIETPPEWLSEVLIDTWWNVNDAKTDSTEYGGGF